MRRVFIFSLLVMVGLSACGGGDADPTQPAVSTGPTGIPAETTAEPVPSGDQFEDDEAFQALEEQFLPENPAALGATPSLQPGALPVPLPGTLVASETEDPLGPLVFDYLRLDQAGGPNPTQTLTIEIYGDGRILRNGIEATLGQEQVAQVDDRLDAINFFGLQNMFVGPPGRGDEYTYTLFVRQQDRQRRINAQDGFIPEEVRQTLALIVLMGDVVPPPTPVIEATPTATEDGP